MITVLSIQNASTFHSLYSHKRGITSLKSLMMFGTKIARISNGKYDNMLMGTIEWAIQSHAKALIIVESTFTISGQDLL